MRRSLVFLAIEAQLGHPRLMLASEVTELMPLSRDPHALPYGLAASRRICTALQPQQAVAWTARIAFVEVAFVEARPSRRSQT